MELVDVAARLQEPEICENCSRVLIEAAQFCGACGTRRVKMVSTDGVVQLTQVVGQPNFQPVASLHRRPRGRKVWAVLGVALVMVGSLVYLSFSDLNSHHTTD